MEREYSNIKSEASSKLFDLIIKGSVKEARKILIELSEKFQESHETRYLKGLKNIIEEVRDPKRVINAIDKLKEHQFEIGRVFTEEETKALADLRNYYKLKYEYRGPWKHMEKSKMKANRLPVFFINFIDFSEGVAETEFFFLQEFDFFGSLFSLLV